MAKTVYRSEALSLLDGTTVTLKSLSIKKMKEFQERTSYLNADGQVSGGYVELQGMRA